MSWFIFALLSGLCFALARSVARFWLRRDGNSMAFTAWHDGLAGLILLPLFFFFPIQWPQQVGTWWLFIGVVVFALLSDWISFLALKGVEVSTYQIINQVRHVFVLLGAWLLLTEQITWLKVVAILFIMLGVIVAMLENKKIKWTWGAFLTVLSTLAAVIAFMFVKFTVLDFSPIALAASELIVIGLICALISIVRGSKLKSEIGINGRGILISGILFGLFELFIFLALAGGEISRVIPVTQSSLIFTVLIGVIFLQERERLVYKFVGTGLVAIGIIIMNYL